MKIYYDFETFPLKNKTKTTHAKRFFYNLQNWPLRFPGQLVLAHLVSQLGQIRAHLNRICRVKEKILEVSSPPPQFYCWHPQACRPRPGSQWTWSPQRLWHYHCRKPGEGKFMKHHQHWSRLTAGTHLLDILAAAILPLVVDALAVVHSYGGMSLLGVHHTLQEVVACLYGATLVWRPGLNTKRIKSLLDN